MHTLSKKLVTSVLALCTFGGLALGCEDKGSSSGLDTGSAIGKFQHPTGSFSSENGGDAFSGYQSKHQESSHVAVPDGTTSAGTSSTQSLHILTNATAKSQCSAGASCACETSGSFVFEKDSSAENTVRIHFDKCMSADGSGFDGDAVLVVSDQPIVGVTKKASVGSAVSAAAGGASKSKTQALPTTPSDDGYDDGYDDSYGGDGYGDDDDGFGENQPSASNGSSTVDGSTTKNFLLTAKGTGYGEGKSMELEFSLAQESGYVLLSVDIADGNIVVGMAPDGTAFVKAKQGTWYCSPSNSSGYSCTSEDGAPQVDVANTGSVSSAAPKSGTKAPAPATSSGNGSAAEHDPMAQGDDDDNSGGFGF